MNERAVSKSTLKRLPLYLTYLKSLPPDRFTNISATAIATALDMGEVLVRKDLAQISEKGRPRVGYEINSLIAELEGFLGYNDTEDAVVVGAGKLGRALIEYGGFAAYGLHIIAGFDKDAGKQGTTDNGIPVMDIRKLPQLCRRMNIRIGIIAVPAECAQEICDLLTESGVLAIMNFAPSYLKADEGIMIQNENIAAALAVLSNRLKRQIGMGAEA